jgi:glycosyltransferase involved in cell wall biosynthesis
MTDPLVSVVIPTFNYGHCVAEAVESALGQTYSPVEVIVVDDGSTDDTAARLEPYRDRINYIYQPNQGLSAARNTGIRAARGALIALLDSDDAFHPRKLELQVAHLRAHPDVGLVATDCFTEPGRKWPAIPGPVRAVRETLRRVVARARFGPSSVLVRRECFDRVGLFDPTLRSVEDKDMWVRLADRYPVARLAAPLCWYREHAGSMSRNPGRMEAFDHLVLERAFRLPALRSARSLRRKAYSHAALSAAWLYLVAGCPWAAARRAARALWLWPLPYPRDEIRTPLMRLRILTRAGLNGLRQWPRKGSNDPEAVAVP